MFASLAPLPSAAFDHVNVPGGGGTYSVRGKTFMDRRFTDVIRQRHDFSCGSAALATLLTYHYNHPVDEMTVLDAMFAQGDQDKIRKEGFSLLDMKTYLGSIGYRAEGFKESLEKLEQVGIPAIVLINKNGYLHFVVIKGIKDDKVAVGDPTLGVNIYSRNDFNKMWSGILFVVMDRMDAGRTTFNQQAAWRPFGLPQFRNMLDTGQLGSVTLNTAFSPNYY